MHRYTKEEAISIVTDCAKKYKENLADKKLLFVCQDKHNNISCVEFSFYTYNYLHLTGLKVKRETTEDNEEILNASLFYDRCLKHRLSPSDFEFSDDGTTHMKLNVLSSVLNKNLSANMIGDYNSYNPKLYTEKLVGGVKACIGFVKTQNRDCFVPNTVLKTDIRDYTKNTARVIAVFRKNIDQQTYEEITYKAKKIDWTLIQYPENYSYLYSLSKNENT